MDASRLAMSPSRWAAGPPRNSRHSNPIARGVPRLSNLWPERASLAAALLSAAGARPRIRPGASAQVPPTPSVFPANLGTAWCSGLKLSFDHAACPTKRGRGATRQVMSLAKFGGSPFSVNRRCSPSNRFPLQPPTATVLGGRWRLFSQRRGVGRGWLPVAASTTFGTVNDATE